jgi:hypothetical protein
MTPDEFAKREKDWQDWNSRQGVYADNLNY